MKKLFSVVLCLTMILNLAACGAGGNAETAPSAQQAAPAASGSAAETDGWVPTKQVEIVTHSGVGAGGDLIGRAIIEATQGLVPQNMFMQNKKGSAGSNVWAYVKEGKTDGHTLIVGTPTNFPWYYNANNGMHPTEDLVPLARFQLEPQVLVVHKDSPYQDIASFLEAYKAGNATIAGEASGGPAWMCATIMADTLGCGTSYIPYTDGGEALTALLGKNVDAVFGQLGEVYDQLAAGEVRALAFAEDKRVEQFPDIPTLTESDVDFVFPQWRGLFVRKGTPDEAIEYWEKIFAESSQSESFQKWLADSGSLDGWMGHEEFLELCKQQDKTVKEIIAKYGTGE